MGRDALWLSFNDKDVSISLEEETHRGGERDCITAGSIES